MFPQPCLEAQINLNLSGDKMQNKKGTIRGKTKKNYEWATSPEIRLVVESCFCIMVNLRGFGLILEQS